MIVKQMLNIQWPKATENNDNGPSKKNGLQTEYSALH